ncbi:MAG TPA: amidohydrolase family protein, partial [Chloroflexota bacterium]|nr:amidohydrolase family protein [Chloroflexota bacterium]
HVWSEDRERYPRSDTPYRASPELLLDYMDEAGVAHAVIVLPMYYRYDNRVLADTIRQYPGKFAGVGVVDPVASDAPDHLTRLVEEDGIRGVRLRATIEEEAFGSPESEPLWRRATELDVPVCLLGKPQHVKTMRQMVERFPETTVVIDHFANIPASGGVESEPFQTFLSLAELPKVFIKLSGLHYWGEGRYPWPAAQPLLRAAIDRFTPERVMWGSDWPHVLFGSGYIRCLNFVRRELTWLSESERDQILGGTALKLWRLP